MEAITNITNYLIIKSNIVDYTCERHAFAPQPHVSELRTLLASCLLYFSGVVDSCSCMSHTHKLAAVMIHTMSMVGDHENVNIRNMRSALNILFH